MTRGSGNAGLARRLRAVVLQRAHAAWVAMGGPWPLPGLDQLDAMLPDQADFSLAEIDRTLTPPGFRLVRVGAAVAQRASQGLVGQWIGTGGTRMALDPLGSQPWAYGQCLQSAMPSYEFGHFDCGDGPAMLFERLLLPLGRGALPMHILCGAIFTAAA